MIDACSAASSVRSRAPCRSSTASTASSMGGSCCFTSMFSGTPGCATSSSSSVGMRSPRPRQGWPPSAADEAEAGVERLHLGQRAEPNRDRRRRWCGRVPRRAGPRRGRRRCRGRRARGDRRPPPGRRRMPRACSPDASPRTRDARTAAVVDRRGTASPYSVLNDAADSEIAEGRSEIGSRASWLVTTVRTLSKRAARGRIDRYLELRR